MRLGLVNRCFIAYEFCCWWSMQTLTFIGKYLKEVVVPFVSVFGDVTECGSEYSNHKIVFSFVSAVTLCYLLIR